MTRDGGGGDFDAGFGTGSVRRRIPFSDPGLLLEPYTDDPRRSAEWTGLDPDEVAADSYRPAGADPVGPPPAPGEAFDAAPAPPPPEAPPPPGPAFADPNPTYEPPPAPSRGDPYGTPGPPPGPTYQAPVSGVTAFGSPLARTAYDMPGEDAHRAPNPPGPSGFAGPESTTYGQPDAGATTYGQPGAGTTAYGQPPGATPYGQPPGATPYGQPPGTTPYGQPDAGTTAYGQPDTTTTYGQPDPGATPYGQPDGTTMFGQPGAATTAYGQPDTTTTYGQPDTSALFGPSGAPTTAHGQPDDAAAATVHGRLPSGDPTSFYGAGPAGPHPLGPPPSAKPRRRGRWIVALVIFLVIAGAGAVAGAGVTGRGPLRGLSANETGAGDEGTSTRPAPPPRNFTPGSCAVLEGLATSGDVPQVVVCDQPHTIEFTDAVNVGDLPGDFPSEEAWNSIANERCRAAAEATYGAKLDPEGRFTPAGIPPAEAAWLQGDRKLWCGIALSRSLSDATGAGEKGEPLVGPVKGQPQFWTYKAGDCLTGLSPVPVACTQPHELEVVGETTLGNRASVPPVDDAAAWQKLVGSSCDSKAKTYLGKAPKAPWEVASLPIPPGSWAANKRNVTCVVGSAETSGWATVTGSVKTR